jgi:hypothetical protein
MITMLLALIVMPLALIIVSLIGYFFGVIVTLIPLIGDILTVPGISTPTIFAWVFISAFMVAIYGSKSSGDK